MVALGAVLSAAFIMAANSWMQHPVGYKLGDRAGRADDIGALLTNPVFLWGYLHVLLAALVTGSVVMLAVSAWHLRRGSDTDAVRTVGHGWRSSCWCRPPSWLMLVGSQLGVIEAKYQPMKIAAAEAQWETCQPCSFSLFQIGGGNRDETPTKIIEIPHLLSLLATNSWNGQVQGLNELNAQYQQQYGPGRLRAERLHPVLVDARHGLPRRRWCSCSRCGAAGCSGRRRLDAVAVVPAARHLGRLTAVHHQHRGLDADRERPAAVDRAGADEDQRRRLAVGRHDRDLTSIIAFFLLYAVLAVVAWGLMVRYARRGLRARRSRRPGGAATRASRAMTY